MQQFRSNRLASITVACAAASFASGAASAQVQIAEYVSTASGLAFEYKIANMPDFDQRRAFGVFGTPTGLPGNGGMYCVPTAAMNVFAYLANHGDPTFMPAAADFQSQDEYEPTTWLIALLGGLMGTDAADGTGGTGCTEGYTQWLADYDDQDRYCYLRDSASGWYCPSFDQLTATAISTGGVIGFAFGRYPISVITDDYIQVTGRSGGHAITLDRALRTSGGGIIGYRDPADDSESLTSQSEFITRLAAVDDLSIRFFSNSLGEWVIRMQSSLNFDPRKDDKVRSIDSYNVVYPKSVYSLGADEFVAVSPNPLAGSPPDPWAEVTFSPFAPVLDGDLDAALVHWLAITKSVFVGSTPQLVRRHRLTGESQTIAPVPGATDIVVGRNRQVYVGGGSTLRRFDLDRPEGEQLLSTINVGQTISDVFYNDATDQVVVFSIPGERILRYPASLSPIAGPMVSLIPAGVEMSGDGSVIVNPLDGKHWIMSEGSNSLFGLTLGGTGVAVQTLSLPALTDPRSFDFDDRGHMFVNNHGVVVELKLIVVVGGGASWQVVPASPFAGIPSAGGLRMSRSRTNYDPDEHDFPGWNTNIPPSELTFDEPVADCLADFNGDEAVNGLDLATLLGAWSPAPGSAASCGGITPCPQDLNHDARVNGLDLAILLSAWGACD